MAESSNGRHRPLIILIFILLIVALIIAGMWLWPRLSAPDEIPVISVMPVDTAVYTELNLQRLDDEAAQMLVSQLGGTADNPITLLALFDDALQEATGLTASDNILPWIGSSVGLGLLPPTDDQQPRWILAATVRDKQTAAEFTTTLTDALSQNSDHLSGFLSGTEPAAAHTKNLFVLASDAAALETAVTYEERPSLAESEPYQQLLAQLPPDSPLTIVVNEAGFDIFRTTVPQSSADYAAVIQEILPVYTAVALAANPTTDGVQMDMIALHEPLTAVQQELLAAQTAVPQLDDRLPQETAVYLNGQRLDLIWQQLKGALEPLGYEEADIEESLALFTNLLGFNPDTEFLATLNGGYTLALLPNSDETMRAVALAELADPEATAAMAEEILPPLILFGAVQQSTKSIYEVPLPDQPLNPNFSLHKDLLIVGTDAEAVTAVTQSETSLTAKLVYQGVWETFPDGSVPILFVDLALLPDAPTAVDIFSHAALATHSDNDASQATLILFTRRLGD